MFNWKENEEPVCTAERDENNAGCSEGEERG